MVGDRLNILFVCHRFPFPPTRGGKIRPFHIVQHLTEAGHRVTVASLARSPQEQRDAAGIAAHCAAFELARVSAPVQVARMLARLPSPQPSSMGYFYSRRLARRIDAILHGPRLDLILVHCSSVAQYVAEVRGIPKILDFGDMDSHKWLDYAQYNRFPRSLGYRIEGEKMLRAEKRLAGQFDLCTATTNAEWETLAGYGVHAHNGWFPNGVNGDYFAPADGPYDTDTICFLGRMDYFPNQQCMLEFCAQVLPRLQARRPGIKLAIVGASPSPAIRRLGDLPGVTVTGSVPDVRPYLQRAALSVAPLRIARGTQNKILEAMAAGIPVVTTRLAAGGVDAVAGEHLLAADDPQAQTQAILRILEDPQERARLAAAGRARMLSHHQWQGSMSRLDALIDQHLGLAV
jgi:polysaccharide biosynthesis protein PslH